MTPTTTPTPPVAPASPGPPVQAPPVSSPPPAQQARRRLQTGKINEEWETRALAWWGRYRGRILGVLGGLLLAWIVIRIGWIQAFTIAVFLYIGYSVGGSFDPE